jgi:hypothetical protein
VRLVRVAQRYAENQRVRYTGIDLFEARPQDRPGWTIKRAHKTLASLGAKVQLVPGDPLSALARCANALASTDIVIISADQDLQSLRQAWFYVPRMLHDKSCVFLEEPGTNRDGASELRILSPADLVQFTELASAARQRAA